MSSAYKIVGILLLFQAAGCATGSSARLQKEIDALHDQVSDLKTVNANLRARIDALDGGHSAQALSTPAAPPTAKMSIPTPVVVTPLKTGPVTETHTAGIGTGIEAKTAETDPEAGFANDSVVREYRRAMILFDAQKLGEASLAFDAFVEKHPDHPLAGSAQYYSGECAYLQKDYPHATDGFNRVLTSYDRSSHVADTLRDLSASEDALGKTKEAARHRQLLSSLFPQSPAMATAPPPEHVAAPETDAVPATAPVGAPVTAPMAHEGAEDSHLESPPAPVAGSAPATPASSESELRSRASSERAATSKPAVDAPPAPEAADR